MEPAILQYSEKLAHFLPPLCPPSTPPLPVPLFLAHGTLPTPNYFLVPEPFLALGLCICCSTAWNAFLLVLCKWLALSFSWLILKSSPSVCALMALSTMLGAVIQWPLSSLSLFLPFIALLPIELFWFNCLHVGCPSVNSPKPVVSSVLSPRLYLQHLAEHLEPSIKILWMNEFFDHNQHQILSKCQALR